MICTRKVFRNVLSASIVAGFAVTPSIAQQGMDADGVSPSPSTQQASTGMAGSAPTPRYTRTPFNLGGRPVLAPSFGGRPVKAPTTSLESIPAPETSPQKGEATINNQAHMRALVHCDRGDRRFLKLWPGKETLFYYEWVMPDGSVVQKFETTKFKHVPDERPLRESHPNLAIAIPGLTAAGAMGGPSLATAWSRH